MHHYPLSTNTRYRHRLCTVIITVWLCTTATSSNIPNHISQLLEPSSLEKDLLHASLLAYEPTLDPDAPLQASLIPELGYLQSNNNNDQSFASYFSKCYDPTVGGEVVDIFRHPIKHVLKSYFKKHFKFFGKDLPLSKRIKTLMSEIVFIIKNVIQCVKNYFADKIGGPKLGLTSLSAMTDEEYQSMFPKKLSSNSTPLLGASHHSTTCEWNKKYKVHSKYDWRTKGDIFPPIKDQHQCGSCYIFAAISVFEAAYARKHGKATAFSEQQVVNCFSSDTCNGGHPWQVLDYMINNGAVKEKKVPYVGEQHSCAKHTPVAYVKSWCRFDDISDDLVFQTALHELGPLSIDIGVPDDRAFKHLRDNWDGDCLMETNHAVVLVGYTKHHWIIRNTWGADWGKDGYLYLSRGGNRCNMYNKLVAAFV